MIDDTKVDGVMIGAYGHEAQEGLDQLKKYVQRAQEEVGEDDWKHWDYVQKSNKEFDMRRLDGQIRALRQMSRTTP